MSENEQLERKAMEAEYLRVQTSEIQKQIAQLQAASQELRATKAALDNLEFLKKGTLFPLGAGVFVKSVVPAPDSLLVDVGARTLAQQSPENVRKLLEERLSNLEKSMMELTDAYSAGQERMQALASEFQRLNRMR